MKTELTQIQVLRGCETLSKILESLVNFEAPGSTLVEYIPDIINKLRLFQNLFDELDEVEKRVVQAAIKVLDRNVSARYSDTGVRQSMRDTTIDTCEDLLEAVSPEAERAFHTFADAFDLGLEIYDLISAQSSGRD